MQRPGATVHAADAQLLTKTFDHARLVIAGDDGQVGWFGDSDDLLVLVEDFERAHAHLWPWSVGGGGLGAKSLGA